MSKIKFSKIADLVAGQSPKSIYYSKKEGVPFLQGNKTFGNKYPNIDTYTTKTTKMAKKGDILMTVRAPVGEFNIASTDLCIGRGLAAIRAKNKKNKFLYYALKYNVKKLKQQGNGTTYSAVNKQIIQDMMLEIPSSEQKQDKIGEILWDLEEKIELNNTINKELESLIEKLFIYWFVQFDFPDKNKEPYKASKGEMVWNDKLGKMIPKGWKVGTFFDFIQTEKVGDWGKEEKVGNYTLQVNCIRGTDFLSICSEQKLETPVRFMKKDREEKILKDGDILIEISGGSPIQSTGRIAYINEFVLKRFKNPIITSNFCKVLSLKKKSYRYWFYLAWKRLYEGRVFFQYEGKTTGIKNFLFEDFCSDYAIAIPPDEIIQAFDTKVTKFFEKIQYNKLENQQLEELKDFLLPVLMQEKVNFFQKE